MECQIAETKNDGWLTGTPIDDVLRANRFCGSMEFDSNVKLWNRTNNDACRTCTEWMMNCFDGLIRMANCGNEHAACRTGTDWFR